MRRSRGDRPTERSRGTRDPTEAFADGRFVADKLARGVDCVAEFRGIGEAADVAHGRIGHDFKQGVVLEVVSSAALNFCASARKFKQWRPAEMNAQAARSTSVTGGRPVWLRHARQ